MQSASQDATLSEATKSRSSARSTHAGRVDIRMYLTSLCMGRLFRRAKSSRSRTDPLCLASIHRSSGDYMPCVYPYISRTLCTHGISHNDASSTAVSAFKRTHIPPRRSHNDYHITSGTVATNTALSLHHVHSPQRRGLARGTLRSAWRMAVWCQAWG